MTEINNTLSEFDFINQCLLTENDVRNILNNISPELNDSTYVTYNYPNNEMIKNYKYSIINIKQFDHSEKLSFDHSEKLSFDKNKDINSDIYSENDDSEDLYLDINDILNLNKFDDIYSSKDNIGHFILIINCSVQRQASQEIQKQPFKSTCLVYPLYYIHSDNLEEYLEDKCGFKNVVWCYDVIQHGNSSSCGWICCKIAFDYFSKNIINKKCIDFEITEI